MKRWLIGLFVSVLILTSIGRVLWGNKPALTPVETVPQAVPTKPSGITVTLNMGDSVSTYSGVMAINAFEALLKVSSDSGLPIESKQYDFGVFVSSIAGRKNTSEKAWVYYVNGQSADVAADKKSVQAGDTVEWRYTKPLF